MFHPEEDVLTEFIDYMKGIYGELSVLRGNVHNYLGMCFDFSDRGKVGITIPTLSKEVIVEFPEELTEDPAGSHLFDVRDEKSRVILPEEQAQIFHRLLAKLLYLSIRTRRDISMPVAFLTIRVRQPDQDNWAKLRRGVKYLYRNPNLPLTLNMTNMSLISCWVGASFTVHPDYKGHTGGTMSLGKGSMIDICQKQKFNTRSLTEVELVSVDDCVGRM